MLTEQNAEPQQLIAGLSNTVSKVSLVSLTVCCQAMAEPSLKVPAQLLAGFQLKDKSAQQTMVTTQHNSNLVQVQMLWPLPTSLLARQVASSSFGH